MSKAYLEHINISVRNPIQSARELCEIFDWKIRWQGSAIDGGFSVHVGSENHYIALYNKGGETAPAYNSYVTLNGLNHLAVVVDDLDGIETRVKALGYETHSHADYEPGRRFYFHDKDNLVFEVVSYL